MPRFLLTCLMFLLAGAYPDSAIASFPSEAESIRQLRCRAVDCELRGDRDSAIDLNRQAINLAGRAFGTNAPFLADIYYDIGSLALCDSKFNLAEESFNQSLQLNPNCYAARIKLAELMHIRGHSDVAAKESQMVLSKHRNNVSARAILAVSYQDLGKPYKAIRECYFLDQAMRGKNPPAPYVAPLPPPPPDNEAAENAKKEAEQKASKEKALKEKALKEKTEKAAREKSTRERISKKPEKKPIKTPAKTSVGTTASTSLESKAILLTPVKQPKKAAPVKPTHEEAATETPENSAEEAIKEIVKPQPVKRPKPSESVARTRPRSGGGLVPPPPPVVPVYSPMVPVIARPSLPKAKPVEKEKPKEKVPEVKEEKAPAVEEKDDDFLLDWGDAKNKKKK